jgi:hypothetical protein
VIPQDKKIGVLYLLHGGMDTYNPNYLWDASVQMFSYDHNHPVYHMVIWNPDAWSSVLQTEFAVKFIRKYQFEYERIGGIDPFHRISDKQLADMKTTLDKNDQGLTFEVDYACWMAADRIEHYPYPRFIYNGPEGMQSKCTYCGQDEPGGPWPNCNPDRYDVDGPAERLLKKGVSRIIVIDMTVGGVRFYKTFDVVQMTKRVLSYWNTQHDTSIALTWINDYSNFMERAYPQEPEGWTPILGEPAAPPEILLSDHPNPVILDPDLALLHVEGINARMSEPVPASETGIILFNHGLFVPERKYFDPKIDDTVRLNQNIKSLLLKRHPEINPDNIIGAYGGIKELNPENGLIERTRTMRGEDLGQAYLFMAEKDMPGGEWGYRYWDGLEYLIKRGVQHIVVGFPQVVADSVLTMVELYNQIGKEVGVKSWLHYSEGNYAHYPDAGHPFADYWGNWVTTEQVTASGKTSLCLTMGGCQGTEDYPPPRLTPLEEKREDMDPSLAFDLSHYGNLGYDAKLGPPAPEKPVQHQYGGTWDLYIPPNDDPRLGQLLGKQVLRTVLESKD